MQGIRPRDSMRFGGRRRHPIYELREENVDDDVKDEDIGDDDE